MIRRPPRSTLDRSSAASDVYKRQDIDHCLDGNEIVHEERDNIIKLIKEAETYTEISLSLIHISEPTRPY